MSREEMDTQIEWLVGKRRKLQEKKEHRQTIKPKDHQSFIIYGAKIKVLQGVINHFMSIKELGDD